MSCFWLNRAETNISIPSFEERKGTTYYRIKIKIGNFFWYVRHRYNDFYDLHQQLVNDHGVSKEHLPPKKVINNKCPLFLQTRRKGLQSYLRFVFNFLRTLPQILLQFLDYHYYDVYCLIRNKAFNIFVGEDVLVQETGYYTLNIFELHALSRLFKQSRPPIEEIDQRYDICHIIDLCSGLNHLIVKGIPSLYRNSNIIPNSLPFDFLCFKALRILEVTDVGLDNIRSVGNLRQNLKKLKVCNTNVVNISQILMCDAVHRESSTEHDVWGNIEDLNLSHNKITSVDKAIHLVPNVKTLTLSYNKISEIPNLSFLSNLHQLVLSNNNISICDSLHLKFGNIVFMDLSQNSISSLKGFEKMYSLEHLDLSYNQISDIEEVRHIGNFPCLEYLSLTGNPVAIIVDYRVKVLETFGTRAADICLDNEKASQKEMDTVHILQALRKAKEGSDLNIKQ